LNLIIKSSYIKDGSSADGNNDVNTGNYNSACVVFSSKGFNGQLFLLDKVPTNQYSMVRIMKFVGVSCIFEKDRSFKNWKYRRKVTIRDELNWMYYYYCYFELNDMIDYKNGESTTEPLLFIVIDNAFMIQYDSFMDIFSNGENIECTNDLDTIISGERGVLRFAPFQVPGITGSTRVEYSVILVTVELESSTR
jgi:hypothetical protein